MHLCATNSSLKSIVFKAIMVMLERQMDLRKIENLETNSSVSGKVKQFNET